MKLVLGFAGKARHGKTEACLAIKHYCDSVSTVCKVYEFSAIIYDWCVAQGRLPAGLERRQLLPDQLSVLVAAGNEGRRIREDFWVGQILEAMRRDNPTIAITPNIRFAHEVRMLQALDGADGYVVRCTRLNADGSVYISPDRDPNDVTETSLDLFPVDFYLTAKNGHADLMAMQAVQLYKFLSAGGGDRRGATNQQIRPSGDGPVVLDTVREWLDLAIERHSIRGALPPICDPENLKMLLADLIKRSQMGAEKYGTPLRTDNGRNALLDLYQEVQDGVMYSMQGKMEGDKAAGQYFEILYQIGSQIAGELNRRG